MKNAENLAEWHNQIKNVLKQQQRESELLGISGRARAAFNGNNKSSLPAAASKAERNAATYQRLMGELASLEGRGHLSNANKKRVANLQRAVKEYAPNLQIGGGITVGEFAKVVRKYYPNITEQDILEKYLPERVNSTAELVDTSEAVRSLIRKVIGKIEKGPDTAESKEDTKVMKAAMKWINPAGLPAGYRGGTRSMMRSKRGVTFANREGPTLGKLLPVLSRYVDEPANKLKVVFDPATNARNGSSKKQAVQSLIMEALHKYKNAPDSVQKRDDEAIMKAAARITAPTGVVGYGASWRNSTRHNRNNNMNGGGCGCSGGTAPPLFPAT